MNAVVYDTVVSSFAALNFGLLVWIVCRTVRNSHRIELLASIITAWKQDDDL